MTRCAWESNAYVFSFSKSNLCGTESKVLQQKTEHTLCLDSSALNQSCVTASRAVTVDFPDCYTYRYSCLASEEVLNALGHVVVVTISQKSQQLFPCSWLSTPVVIPPLEYCCKHPPVLLQWGCKAIKY